MSFSSQSLPSGQDNSVLIDKIAKLEDAAAAIVKRIKDLESAKVIQGYEKETDLAEIQKVRANRLRSYTQALDKLQARLKPLKQAAAEAARRQNTAVQPMQQSQSESPRAPAIAPANRDWYKQFENSYIDPAFNRLTRHANGSRKKHVNENEVIDEFIGLTQQIVAHYQTQLDVTNDALSRQALDNLAQYMEALRIANEELKKIKKTIMGYSSLLTTAVGYLTSGKKANLELPGELGRAYTAFMAVTRPTREPSANNKFSITCHAERDLVLMTNKFLDYFVLSDHAIPFDSKSMRAAMGRDLVKNSLRNRRRKNDFLIASYETPVIDSTLDAEDSDLNDSPVSVSRNSASSNDDRSPSASIVTTSESSGEDDSPTVSEGHLFSDSDNSRLQQRTRSLSASDTSLASQTRNRPTSRSVVNPPVTLTTAVAETKAITPAAGAAQPVPITLPERPSFFQRHKKKILWGLAIGLFIGVCIATAGVAAIATVGAAATAVATIGITTTLQAIGLGAAAAVTSGLIGVTVGGTAGAISDCTNPSDETLAVTDAPYVTIHHGGNTSAIHRQMGMPIVQQQRDTQPQMQNSPVVVAHTQPNGLQHAVTNDSSATVHVSDHQTLRL